jgi:hypothetical protein
MCYCLGKWVNYLYLGLSIMLQYCLHLAPTPSPLALVQRVIAMCSSCPGISLDPRSVVVISGRCQEALDFHHSSRWTDVTVLLKPTTLRHGLHHYYISRTLNSSKNALTTLACMGISSYADSHCIPHSESLVQYYDSFPS